MTLSDALAVAAWLRASRLTWDRRIAVLRTDPAVQARLGITVSPSPAAPNTAGQATGLLLALTKAR